MNLYELLVSVSRCEYIQRYTSCVAQSGCSFCRCDSAGTSSWGRTRLSVVTPRVAYVRGCAGHDWTTTTTRRNATACCLTTSTLTATEISTLSRSARRTPDATSAWLPASRDRSTSPSTSKLLVGLSTSSDVLNLGRTIRAFYWPDALRECCPFNDLWFIQSLFIVVVILDVEFLFCICIAFILCTCVAQINKVIVIIQSTASFACSPLKCALVQADIHCRCCSLHSAAMCR